MELEQQKLMPWAVAFVFVETKTKSETTTINTKG